jgi:hypothetical protein
LQDCPAEPLEAANGCWVEQREQQTGKKHTGSSGSPIAFANQSWLVTYWDGFVETFITSGNGKAYGIITTAANAKLQEEMYEKYFKRMLNSIKIG